MKETKFTKGPWINNEQGFLIGEDGAPVRVSGLGLMQSFADCDEHKANANLMRLAPDMYEMLESKLDLIRCGIGANYSGDPKQNPKYLEVVELLKRARGE